MRRNQKTDILILGAGIGGYETFRTLSKLLKRHHINKKITIVDQNNYFTFVPMLHEVATGSIEPTHCAVSLRELIYKTPHQFIKARVEHIDPTTQIVETSEGSITYEYIIIALGSETNYFNTPGAKEYSHNVRSLSSALALKYDFLSKIDNGDDHIEVNIVGGGYTGIEVAGQFSDLALRDVKKLYPEKKLTIRIIHGGSNLLMQMSKTIQQKVLRRLQKRSVEILLDSYVSKVEPNSIILKDNTALKSNVTIWTAGFENIAPKYLDTVFCINGRIKVTRELTIPNCSHTYAIGDNAEILDPNSENSSPQLAEATHKEGRYVAHHIVKTLQSKKNKQFMFYSKGTLMPVGDWYGVAQIGPFILFGKLAWWIRRTVYVLFMPGFLRKLRIIIDWTIHTFSFRHLINIKK